MTDNEMLDAMRDLLMPINLKVEKMDNRINILENRIANIELEMSSIKLEMNRGFRKNNDEIQTLVAVLEAKNILPIAK